jgi:hypothetical protein
VSGASSISNARFRNLDASGGILGWAEQNFHK